MASYETHLTIANLTVNPVTITVSATDNYDWDGDSRPDHNFQNVTIAPYDSSAQREEVNAAAESAWYTMSFQFSNGEQISLRNDQYDARGVQNRLYNLDGPDAAKYKAHQTSGGGFNSFAIVGTSP
jgi:1-phosphatidylinositol phosphodiesterase